MLLGDYYDEVLKEAKAIEEDSDVEAVKLAEAVEILAANNQTFETDEDAFKAASEIVENDYAEKVAAVCSELDSDNIDFDNDEAKIASAIEIVDGWEKIAGPRVDLAKETVKGVGKMIKRDVGGAAKSVKSGVEGAAKTFKSDVGLHGSVSGAAKERWKRLSTKGKIIAGSAVGAPVVAGGALGARKLLRSKKVEVQE